MRLFVCAVLDKKVNAYMNPQFFRTKGEATRAWMDAVAAEGSQFKRHAEDYVFCYLGYYDDSTGTFENVGVVPEMLMTALDCVVVDNGVN